MSGGWPICSTGRQTPCCTSISTASPRLAVPVLTLIGREHVSQGLADDALLIEAEALAAEAMRLDEAPLVEGPKRA